MATTRSLKVRVLATIRSQASSNIGFTHAEPCSVSSMKTGFSCQDPRACGDAARKPDRTRLARMRLAESGLPMKPL